MLFKTLRILTIRIQEPQLHLIHSEGKTRDILINPQMIAFFAYRFAPFVCELKHVGCPTKNSINSLRKSSRNSSLAYFTNPTYLLFDSLTTLLASHSPPCLHSLALWYFTSPYLVPSLLLSKKPYCTLPYCVSRALLDLSFYFPH